jgi:hypothetical protein
MKKNFGESRWLTPAVVCVDAAFGLACVALLVGLMNLVAQCGVAA